ncbi:MAG: T9SS type A sorting domain-containing protein, partial [Bacteroidota bacterium]
IICLTATNECDSFTYCDTLTLDSNGMFFTFGKKGNDPIVLQEKPTDVLKQLSYHRAMNKLSVNQPNPFSDKTTIEYQLMEGYGEAEIRISNTLGQAIKTIKLKGNRGFTTIDGSQWRAGLYHYSLIIDGMIIDSKVMAVGR